MLGKRFRIMICALLIPFIGSGCDQSQKTSQTHFDSNDLCDFHQGACQLMLDENIVELSITPADAPSEKPLIFQLKISDTLRITESVIEGRDMFMGIIPLNWQKRGENLYQSSVIYGSCASGYMVWRLKITFINDKGLTKQAWFDFLADNNSD
ncbi:hypothetical protein [Shewanella sp.]|uniref:hypothetical protein n=1 Tax=Shewanella sp. TaxID=50422 RepID=UPI0035621BE8